MPALVRSEEWLAGYNRVDDPVLGYEHDDGGRSAAGFKGTTGDCCTRAIAIAAGLDYRQVYDAMAEAMKANGYAASGNAYATRKRKAPRQRGQRNARRVQDDVLASFGFTKVKLPKGNRPTYAEAHDLYGDCIVTTVKHFAALVGGDLRDIFDGRSYEWADEYGDIEVRERKALSVWVLSR